MSDFHTWNELQEDTTGTSAYANAAPDRMRHGKLGVQINGVESNQPRRAWYLEPPGQDRHPGFVEALPVFPLVGGTQRIAASEKFEHAGMPCSGKIASTADT